jgi:ketosteroid isomerase-like protein
MADSSSGNHEIVRDFYEKLAANDFANAFALVSPDAVIREPGDLPFGGDYAGQARIGELLQRMGEVVELGIANSTIMDGTESFAVKVLSRMSPRDGGEPVEVEILELITVRDGKIVEIDVYHKTPSIVAGLWA